MHLPHQRLWILAGALAAICGIAFFLPEAPPIKSSRLAPDLPTRIGLWRGERVPVSQREREVLAADTRFERRVYQRLTRTLPDVEASFVFSGKDMNNSIHRPEVCLRAQNWNFVSERYTSVPGILPGGHELPVRELVLSRIRQNPETGEPVTLDDGTILQDWQLIYYTFIGAEGVTASHYGRALRDIRDRLVGGYDQQWAYATFSSVITGKYQEQGVSLGPLQALDIDGTGEHLERFMRELMPAMISSSGTTGTPASPL